MAWKVAQNILDYSSGLSETILIFKQHLNFLGAIDELTKILKSVKAKACEKKVIAEIENLDQAIKLLLTKELANFVSSFKYFLKLALNNIL